MCPSDSLCHHSVPSLWLLRRERYTQSSLVRCTCESGSPACPSSHIHTHLALFSPTHTWLSYSIPNIFFQGFSKQPSNLLSCMAETLGVVMRALQSVMVQPEGPLIWSKESVLGAEDKRRQSCPIAGRLHGFSAPSIFNVKRLWEIHIRPRISWMPAALGSSRLVDWIFWSGNDLVSGPMMSVPF